MDFAKIMSVGQMAGGWRDCIGSGGFLHVVEVVFLLVRDVGDCRVQTKV